MNEWADQNNCARREKLLWYSLLWEGLGGVEFCGEVHEAIAGVTCIYTVCLNVIAHLIELFLA